MKWIVAIAFSSLGITYWPVYAQPQASTPAQPSSTHKACSADRHLPSEPERLLASGKFDDAVSTARTALGSSDNVTPAVTSLRVVLVSALLGQGKMNEAHTEAETLASQAPGALAEVALSEVAYRAGDPKRAFEHAQAAIALDPCEGRAAGAVAHVLALQGQRRTAAAYLAQGVHLRPNDQVIRREWIDSLPFEQRAAELVRYLNEHPDESSAPNKNDDSRVQFIRAQAANPCLTPTAQAMVKIPLTHVLSGRNLVGHGLEVSIDGKRRVLQVDTGASGILLTRQGAESLGLTPTFQTSVSGLGSNGSRTVFIAHAAQVKVGDAQFANCLVRILTTDHKLPFDGLIGMDLFRQWTAELDFPQEQLRLAPLPLCPDVVSLEAAQLELAAGTPQEAYVSPQQKDWLRALTLGHYMLVPARVNDGTTHFLALDTGADVTVLSRSMANESAALHKSRNQLAGLSGSVKQTLEVREADLRFGNLELPNVRLLATDLRDFSNRNGFEISGLLGFATLERMVLTIDYRDDLIKLTYDRADDPRLQLR